jgi:hypothetical protein
MKFYVLQLVDWLPNAVRQTNQPKHIKPFLQVGISNDLASLLYCRSSAEIITSRTPSAEIITLSAARQLVRCHDNEVTL